MQKWSHSVCSHTAHPVLIKHLLLTILWRVHEDARQFFHKCEMWNQGEPLPKSNLVTLLENELMVVKSITCPYDKFFKKKKEKEKGKGKGREKGKEGDGPKKKRENQATVNPTIPALCIATAVKKIKAVHPNITTITEFAAQTGIPLRDLLTSTRGGCTNFSLFEFEYVRKTAPSTTPQPRFRMGDRRK